jgi:hypothetical protein
MPADKLEVKRKFDVVGLKAPEDWRTPGRFATFVGCRFTRQRSAGALFNAILILLSFL